MADNTDSNLTFLSYYQVVRIVSGLTVQTNDVELGKIPAAGR